MSYRGYVLTNDALVFHVDNKHYHIHKDHPNFELALDAARVRDYEHMVSLVDIPSAIRNWSGMQIRVNNDKVIYKDQPLNNVLVSRILAMARDGYDVTPMLNFLDNLMANPSKRAVDELYLFLEHNGIPITDDGCFLAYKRVRGDYRDIHTGTMDNSVGKVVEVPRNSVDEDRFRTCSQGLHFCSLPYLKLYGSFSGGDRVVIVKINPRDVVAIPSDYDNAKGRTCRLEVVGETTRDDQEAFTKPVESKDNYSDDRYEWR